MPYTEIEGGGGNEGEVGERGVAYIPTHPHTHTHTHTQRERERELGCVCLFVCVANLIKTPALFLP